MSINFTKNQEEITKAWRHVVDSKDSPNWALFGYEERSNNIKLQSTGTNGLKELVQEFSSSQVQYAFCRIVEHEAGLNKLVLINWQGESSDPARKGIYASHLTDVANYFKGCSQTLTIRNDDEATPEYLMEQILKKSSSRIFSMPTKETTNSTASNNSPVANVGSAYKKIDIKEDIKLDKTFWQRQEEEEKQRLAEEKKRAIEKQAQYEKERKLREESEAKKLAETIKERDRIIEATRQAERRESSGSISQPGSMVGGRVKEDDSDERVGRRSELIRLERNQETQSLISKGLIKNKRAIFEQAAAQEQQQQQKQKPAPLNHMVRRPSGTIVSERLNTFQSLDSGSSSSSSLTHSGAVEKLTNGIAKHVNLDGGDGNGVKQSSGGVGVVKKEIETIKITNDDEPKVEVSSNDTSDQKEAVKVEPVKIENEDAAAEPIVESPKKQAAAAIVAEEAESQQHITNDTTTTNNSNKSTTESNGTQNSHMINDTLPPPTQTTTTTMSSDSATGASTAPNGNVGITAKALYDYQAADSTEISFDPDDLIGYIEKVDAGWWHGSVITGRFTGLSGLFPANYVEELNK